MQLKYALRSTLELMIQYSECEKCNLPKKHAYFYSVDLPCTILKTRKHYRKRENIDFVIIPSHNAERKKIPFLFRSLSSASKRKWK